MPTVNLDQDGRKVPAVGRRISGFRCTICSKMFRPGTPECPQHGRALVPVDRLLGRVVDQTWRLDVMIGRGGMSDVYEAVHITEPGKFAVKVLSPKHSRDLATVKRFHREADAQARIEHDNALKVLSHGHDEKNRLHYCAMELVDGHELRSEIRQNGPMPVDRAVAIIVQVLDAVQAAHDKGILHRDLKPQNIMVVRLPPPPPEELSDEGEPWDPDGDTVDQDALPPGLDPARDVATGEMIERVRVLDFGGKAIERGLELEERSQTRLTRPGMLFGTPAYMAPEQARGELLDERVDIYASAVTLLHMLLGRSPFKGANLEGTLTNVLTMDPPRPSLISEHSRDIPPGLEAVILKAVSKDPDMRFESARAFRDALLRFSGGAGSEAAGLPPVHQEPTTREALLRVFRQVAEETPMRAPLTGD